MKNTSAKVGDTVRVYTKIPCKYGKKRGNVSYDGVIHEISYRVNNHPLQKLFKNGYVILSGNFLLNIMGQWRRSTKRKISLDCVLRINKIKQPLMREHP